MKVTVFGIGYVGLVQAAVLAGVGHDVVCVDVNAERVENLKKGIIPIYEPGLTPLVQANVEAGRLHFTTDAEVGVKHGRIQFIAVGTPPDEDGSADLQYVLAVAKTIATYMDEHRIIVDKRGGEVFVLDMGEPVKIADLARKIIRLMGFSEKTEENPDGEIEIIYTGLRPGEKLYEELLIGNDPQGTAHPRIMKAKEVSLSWPEVASLLDKLSEASHDFDCEAVIQLLLQAPTGYNSNGKTSDLVWWRSQSQREQAS